MATIHAIDGINNFDKTNPMRNFNWEDARYLLAVARAGKMNVAAEKLGISPITLSRRIAQMEDRLKTKLLSRHNQGVELTASGLKFLSYVERAEVELDGAARDLGGTSEHMQGTVRIAAPEGFVVGILAPNLRQLSSLHPKLNIEFVPLPRGFSISRREADIAIMLWKAEGAKLRSEKLTEYALKFYASKSYLAENPTPQTPDDLNSHKLIGYVSDQLFSEKIDVAREAWPELHTQFAITSPLAQVQAVMGGAGIGLLHEFLLPEDHQLVTVLPEVRFTRNYYMVTHQNLSRTPRIEAVRAWLKSLIIRTNPT